MKLKKKKRLITHLIIVLLLVVLFMVSYFIAPSAVTLIFFGFSILFAGYTIIDLVTVDIEIYDNKEVVLSYLNQDERLLIDFLKVVDVKIQQGPSFVIELADKKILCYFTESNFNAILQLLDLVPNNVNREILIRKVKKIGQRYFQKNER